MTARLWRAVRELALAAAAPFVAAAAFAALGVSDVLGSFRRKQTLSESTHPDNTAASVVIPNWNGRDLLEKYLPSVVAALGGNPRNEIIVVDNGSEDGSAEWLRTNYPAVRLIAHKRNLGFGAGSNSGFAAAVNGIVVLLNNDMRVEEGFLAPLLASFRNELVFAVSCQIFLNDPRKMREETGLTQGWWENGMLRVRHRIDPGIDAPYPCFYGGGGSCAFDRRKFLELGGFDELLSPFYLEDTDLGYLAWKRGWQVMYEPRSVVYHEHRGTIGRRFSAAEIEGVLKKNYLLFCWKNIHEPKRLASHFAFATAAAVIKRPNASAMWRAFRQLPAALRSRGRARGLAAIDDTEAFRRPMGGYFRDRFTALPTAPEPLRVLFVSPYPMCPPSHGGGVFMNQTVHALARLCELHMIVMLDYPQEREAHRELSSIAATVELTDRAPMFSKSIASITPHAVDEFRDDSFEWLIHRQIYTQQIDVVQLEYTTMAQYAGAFHKIPCILFEHDIYFQSISRALPRISTIGEKAKPVYEYLRALRYELRVLPRMDRVQVCSRENKDYLLGFLPQLQGRIDDTLRAGIDVSRYAFHTGEREPLTLLFLGGFRHTPNLEALFWFTREVLPRVLTRHPGARLIVAGAEPPPPHSIPNYSDAIELRGFVEDAREPLGRCSIFVCPIRNGSGVRVKLLEAFAAGIPVVSTTLGAEGLTSVDGEICALADDAASFAHNINALIENPEIGRAMAERARREMETNRDMAGMSERLMESYRAAVRQKRR